MYIEPVAPVQPLLVPTSPIALGVAPPVAQVTPNRVHRNDCSGPSPAESGPSIAALLIEQSSSSVRNTTASSASGRTNPALAGWLSSAVRIAASGCSKPQPPAPSRAIVPNTSASVPV